MSTYLDMLDAVKNYYGSGSDQWLEIAKYGISSDNAEAILSQVPGVQLIKNSNGSIRSYNYDAFSSISSGTSIAEELNSNLQSGTASIANNTKIKIPSNMGINETGKLTLKSGMKTAGNFVFGEVSPAIAAAGVGISLGKAIDKTLYNLNPDFWDEHGMASLNPDTWNSITFDDNSLNARLFNMVYGISDSNGETQPYIDENALAYLALYMKNKGMFDIEGYVCEPSTTALEYVRSKVSVDVPTKFNVSLNYVIYAEKDNSPSSEYIYTRQSFVSNNEAHVYCLNFCYNAGAVISGQKGWRNIGQVLVSEKPFHIKVTGVSETSIIEEKDSILGRENNFEFYYNYGARETGVTYYFTDVTNPAEVDVTGYFNYLPYLLADSVISTSGGIEGISNQNDATLPNISNAETVEDTLQLLKEQYPDLWNKAIEQDVVQPNGTTTVYKYIPISMPEGSSNLDTEPVSGDATQSNTAINQDTSTQTLIDLITSIITTPPTNTDIPNTGSGDSPPFVIPSGSASALYSIYNPTQAQLNSFGSWLWSSNFVDQLLKLFNDPMQAIIGLHKVFAAPSLSGTSTIKVGYLDSGVSSNVVGTQYTTIDCGEISISEYFGNVFDYDPFTCVYIYLPFIGIERLDSGDVMRGRLRVVYHVDVLTGACLAEIRVTRDGAGGTLYTYTGNCAVQYPISSGSYMGIIASMTSVAGGVVGTIASGGALAPIAMGAVSGVLNAHTRVQHSGGFSGNAGAMGIKTPYVIITRPQTCLADNFPEFNGYPANKSTTLSTCSGFVKVKSCHVSGIPATGDELSEIEMLLKSGVII